MIHKSLRECKGYTSTRELWPLTQRVLEHDGLLRHKSGTSHCQCRSKTCTGLQSRFMLQAGQVALFSVPRLLAEDDNNAFGAET